MMGMLIFCSARSVGPSPRRPARGGGPARQSLNGRAPGEGELTPKIVTDIMERMEAKKEEPEVIPTAVRSAGPSTSTNATAAGSQGSEGGHVKQELMLAPSLKRPREVEDWLLHPPDGSVSRYVIVVYVRKLVHQIT